jgi:hypothetical protein
MADDCFSLTFRLAPAVWVYRGCMFVSLPAWISKYDLSGPFDCPNGWMLQVAFGYSAYVLVMFGRIRASRSLKAPLEDDGYRVVHDVVPSIQEGGLRMLGMAVSVVLVAPIVEESVFR